MSADFATDKGRHYAPPRSSFYRGAGGPTPATYDLPGVA